MTSLGHNEFNQNIKASNIEKFLQNVNWDMCDEQIIYKSFAHNYM